MNPTSSIKGKMQELLKKKSDKKVFNISKYLESKPQVPFSKPNLTTFSTPREQSENVFYLKNIKKNINQHYKHYTTVNICMYTIKSLMDHPYLLYVCEKKLIQQDEVISFPIFKSNVCQDMKSFIDTLKDFFQLENLSFQGYIINNENLFVFLNFNKEELSFTYDTFVNVSMHEICHTKKYYNIDIHPSIISLFYDNLSLMQIYNDKDIPFIIPTCFYYKSVPNTLSNYLGPLKINNLYYDLYGIKEENITNDYKRCLVLLVNTKYIFTSNSEIDIDNVLKAYDFIFISSKVFTDKSLEIPASRIIVKNKKNILHF